MKTVLIVVLLIVFGMVTTEISYGEPVQSSIAKDKFYIFAQIQVTNSNGNLVAYLESNKITILDIDKLNEQLNQNSGGMQKSFIIVEGQKYEMIKGIGVRIYDFPNVISKSIIYNKQGNLLQTLVWADHDGYPVIPGDKVTTTWTIIRPAV